MELFWKAAACVLITVVLVLMLQKESRDISVLLTLVACCMVVTVAMHYLEPAISFFRQLQSLAQLDGDMLTILLKVVGVGLLAEVASLICSDAGNAALGKTLQILASVMVLWISIPLLKSLMELVQKILGEV